MEIALALGGGGVKGNAHIGVMRVLAREGFQVRALAGTSAGGLWGVLFAAGYSADEVEQRFTRLDPDSLYQRKPGDGPGMLGLAGLQQMLEETLRETTFEQLEIPFAVTAVDVDSARPVVLGHGRVRDAILATIAVPGIFPPVTVDGCHLIDGGVLNPVPVDVARRLGPGLPVVAVVLSPPMEGWDGPDKPRLLNTLPFLANYIGRLRVAQAFNIFLRSVDIAGAMMTELMLQLEKPDVIIRPDVPQIGLLDQVDVHEVARLGEQAATQALPALRRAVGWQGRLARLTGLGGIRRKVERG